MRTALPAVIITCALFLAPAAKAEPFKSLVFVPGETLKYRITMVRKVEPPFKAPRPIAFENSFIRVKDDSGRWVIRQLVKEIRDNNTVNLWQFDFSDSYPNTRCLDFSRSMTLRNGREVLREYSSFDDPFLGFPENVVHPVSLPFIMGNGKWEAGKVADAYLWGQDAKPSHIFIEYDGEEEITVPAGTYKGTRLRAKVDRAEVIEPWGAIGNLVAKLIPEFIFWYDREPPHRLLKVKADFGSATPGSPVYYQELTEIVR